MILTGRFIDGVQAWEMGICERLVGGGGDYRKGRGGERETGTGAAISNSERFTEQREAVLDAALQMAIQICNGAPGVAEPAMRAVRAGNEQAENEQYNRILDTEDRREALAAFYEKRKPVFRGR